MEPIDDETEHPGGPWLPWGLNAPKGMEYPFGITEDTRVDLRLSRGMRYNVRAGYWNWKKRTGKLGILSYRVSGPPGTVTPTLDTEKWWTWLGGKNPLEPKTFVEFKMRNGHHDYGAAGNLKWQHDHANPQPWEIIAYRLG